MKFFTCLLLVLAACKVGCHYEADSDALHAVVHSIHGPFYDTTNVNLDHEKIEHMVEELFEKAECEEKASNCSVVSN